MKNTLDQYLEQWGLNNPTLITKTATSHIYKVKDSDSTQVLKLYTPVGQKDESKGATFLALHNGNCAVRIHNYDNNACLMDYIDGPELKTMVEDGKDDEATKIIGETLNKLHALPVPKRHNFQTLEERWNALLNHPSDAPNIIHHGAKIAKELLNNQHNIVLLHSDIHHENIMHSNEHDWIAIDAKGCLGDRAQDCANTFHNPNKILTLNEDRLLRQVDILSQITNINHRHILRHAYVHGCLASCWTHESDGEYDLHVLETSAILKKHI